MKNMEVEPNTVLFIIYTPGKNMDGYWDMSGMPDGWHWTGKGLVRWPEPITRIEEQFNGKAETYHHMKKYLEDFMTGLLQKEVINSFSVCNSLSEHML